MGSHILIATLKGGCNTPLRLILALTALALVGFATASQVSAAPIVTVTGQDVTNNFPEGIEWTIDYESTGEVDGALRYKFEPFGITSTAETDCDDNGCTAALIYPRDVYIPPYTTVTYFWELEAVAIPEDGAEDSDESADPVLTEEETFVYMDTRFEWQTIEQDNILLHYYEAGDDAVQELLDASDETIDYWSEIFEIDIDFPVNIVVYADAQDERGALPINNSSFEDEIITCGSQVAPDIVLMANVPCITPDVTDVLRHELTHLVVEEALRGPFGDIPLWINEGAAVVSQTTPGDYEPVVNAAIRNDDLLTINQISSSPGDPTKVLLFYGESWALVNYLLEEYGEEKFGELFARYREGTTSNAAFEEVYGVDLLGLENEWRESVGLDPREVATPPAAAGEEEDEPDEEAEVASSTSDDEDSKLLPILLVGAITLGMVAALVIGGVFLTRRTGPNS